MRNFTSLAPVALTGPKKLVHKYAFSRTMLAVCMLLLSVAAFSQTSTPVAVTGYTADVIASGTTVASSVSPTGASDVDGGGFYFLNKSLVSPAPGAFGLPISGTISSVSAAGVTFFAPNGDAYNSLRLASSGAKGTLKLVTPQTAGAVYLMCAAGNGPINCDITVYFEDDSYYTYSSQAIPDWYGGTNIAIQGIGRVTTTSTTIDGSSTGTPRLSYISLAILPENYGLKIDSITFQNVNGLAANKIAHILGVSMAAPCAAPATQATLLNLSSTTSTITGSFTAAAPAASGYLVVRYPAGATPTVPVDATTYTAGQTLGTGTVVQSGTATTFTVTNLTANTSYDFYIYAYSSGTCVGGPIYNTTTPLKNTVATQGCGSFAGTYSVGPTGTYPSITAALQALNNGIGGPVTFELQSTYVSTVEKFPIVLDYSGCYSATNFVTIRPAAGANGLQIIDTATGGPAFYFKGANYFTIDGRPGGVGSSIAVTPAGTYNAVNLNIVDNTTTGLAIRFDNGAIGNVVKYCDVQGRNTTSAEKPTTQAGVIYFGNTGATGNDNNTIDHCNIHSTGTGAQKPAVGIYSLGYDNQTSTAAYVPQFNDNNILSNNNIYDFFLASESAGIELNLGNTGWSITGNSLFQTEDIVLTNFSRGIWIPTFRTTFAGEIGNGFSILNNYIGGKGPNCSGGAYTLASGTTGYFQPIEMEVKDATTAGAPTSIQGNTITNIIVNSTTTNNSFDALFFATTGVAKINIGDVTGNVIGSVTGVNGAADGGITITNNVGGTNTGINFSAPHTANISNNKIGNILITGPSNNFGGILIGAAVNGAINNNLITNINATNTASASGKFVNGIQVSSGSPVLSITNNTVQNINCNYATTGTLISQVVGINVSVATANLSGGVTGNIVRNLSNASQSATTTLLSAPLIGMAINSTAAAYTVSNNLIDSLVSTSASGSAALNVIGLYVAGNTSTATTTVTVTKNFIHTLDVSAVNPSAIITGIQHNAGFGTFSNNLVRLGIRADGTPVTTALTIAGISTASTTTVNNFYHNSVYVGGSNVVTGSSNTFAFRRTATTGTYDVRDNIFANARANQGTGGKHYAISSNSTTFTPNYNLYQYNGAGGLFGYNGSVDIAAYIGNGTATANWVAADVNSVVGNPNFINPTGTASAVNLHINTTGASAVEGKGVAIATVTDDIDGETRSGLTPTDIGADAGNFTAAATCATPDAPTNLVLTPAALARINGSFTAPASGASGYIVVRYPNGATPVLPTDGMVYSVGSLLGTGSVIMVGNTTNFIDSGLTASTTYNYYVYSYNAGCLGEPKYSAAVNGAQTTGTCSGPSGLITVGPTGTYPTLTDALKGLYTGGIGGAVTVELQSTYTPTYATTNETFPIVVGANSCFSTTNTVTIRPAANASGLVIRSTKAGPTFDFKGGSYVTIDGRPGGVGTSITKTNAGATNTTNLNIISMDTVSGAAVRFDYGATRNTIKYADLQGQNFTADGSGTTAAGVVYFGNNGVNGNDSNRIDFCNIHSVGTGVYLPVMGVYSQGATNTGLNANFNDADTVSNCNIYDFFHATRNSVGISITQGASNWVVTGNSLFQSENRTSAGVYHRGIWVYTRNLATSVGNGFTITNNYIGGTAPQAAGTPYTVSFNNTYNGIRVETIDGTVPAATTVQGNVLTNLAITSTAGTTNIVTFEGINVTGTTAAVNIIGNTIGATTGNDAIKIAAATNITPVNAGIIASPGAASAVVNVRNNTVGSVTMTANGNAFSCFYSAALGNMIVDGNLFGSLTTANSVQATNTGTTASYIRGIHVGNPGSAASFYSITNNTIANLSNYTLATANSAQTAGIVLVATPNITCSAIASNTIRNLYNASPQTGGSTTASVLGIGMGATSTMATSITNNTVHSLVSGAVTAGIYIEGIFVSGPATVTTYNISKNIVHSFDLTSTTNTSANLRGIELNGGGGNITNNMVRLGIRPDGSSLTNPVRIDAFLLGGSTTLAAANVYNNSAYIGGTGVGGTTTTTAYTAAFHKEVTATSTDVRNNIFVNNRSNALAGANHFAVNISNGTSATFGTNIYRYAGTGGAFASITSTNTVGTAAYISTWIASNDTASQVADPMFIDPTGPATSVDLHITTSAPSPANGAAIVRTQVTDDIDGEARDVSNPDVGADEFTQSNGIDMQAVSLVAPVSPKGCFTNGENVVIKVRNNSSVDLDLTTNPVTVTATVTGAATATLTTVLNTGTITAGTTRDVTLNGTLNMSANGTYIFNAKTSVTGDVKLSNDAMVTDTRVKVTLTAGVINVTASSPYCLKGTPLLGNTTTGVPNGYDTIQWQRSLEFGTGYAGIANAYITPYRDTIYETSYYRLMATCGTDTLYTDEFQVEVIAPKIIATIPAARCDGGKLTLQAFGSPLTQLTWYTDSTGANNTYTTGGSMVTPTLTTTDTFYVSAKTGTCESLRTPVIATVNPSIKIITQPVGQVVCPASTVTFSVTATGAGRTYQWQKDNVNITGATDTFYTIPSTSTANVGEYKVIISGPCGALISSVATLSVASANSWVGIVSSDWNTAANWCGGIPTATTDVTIVPGTPYSPLVSGTGNVHTLSIAKGATVSVANNGTLNIYGDFVNNKGTFNGTGTVALVGTAAQTIGALTTGNLVVNSAGVTLGGNITVVNTLTFTSGHITLGAYNLSISKSTNATMASHVISNSTGSVVLPNLTAAVTAPVGFSATTYNPVTVSSGQGLTYNVRVAEGTIANLAETDKAINRTWTVTTTTEPVSPVSITFQYADNEANANCNPAGLMDVGYYNGITYGMANTNGGITPTGTSAARLVTLTTTQLGSYVVANQGAIKVTIDQFKVQLLPTVINGTSATLRISTPRTSRLEWMILDMAGQLVKKFTTVAGPGVNDINIQLPGLANGVYQLRATSDDGKLPTIRFMIQH